MNLIVPQPFNVTLSEEFEGAATVKPGENYTFTAKNTNYDYAFEGSTMGGEAVVVKDNGDGTFTVESVTGDLVIVTQKTVNVDKLEAEVTDLAGQIAALQQQIEDLENASAADKAALEAQAAELEAALAALEASAATKAELEAQIAALNEAITEIQTGADALKAARKTAIDEINAYADANMDQIPADAKLPVQVIVLQNILKVKDAEDQATIDAAVAAVKAVVDEQVQITADTNAAKERTVSGLKAVSKKQKFTVSWKKTEGADAYQVQYKLKTAGKWSNLKASVKAVKATSKKLVKGKKYSFRVRTITTVNGTKVYGKWSAVKTAKCK